MEEGAASTTGGPPKSGPVRPQLSAAMRSSSSYLREHQQYRPPPGASPVHQRHGLDPATAPPSSSPGGGSRYGSRSESGSGSGVGATPSPAVPFRGIPSPDHPPRVVDSGLNHDLSHPNCAPLPGSVAASRLVATLFYRSTAPRVSNAVHPPVSPSSDGDRHQAGHAPALPVAPAAGAAATEAHPSPLVHLDKLEQAQDHLPGNMAPTVDMDSFPLEPPTADPEPLDHLYGSFVSPLCIASFLHVMSSLPVHAPGSSADHTEPSSAHRCLDGRPHPRVVELTLNPGPSPYRLELADLRRHELINRFEREWNVDVTLQTDSVWRRHPRLVVFDMDSTLITQEVIDLLAATVRDPPDLGARVADITHRAMLGELEFEAAFRERVALLRGLPASLFEDLRSALTVTEGVRPLLRALRRLGVRTAVLSGGFQPLTGWLARELGIDHAHANEVVIDPATATLTGEVVGRIVGRERKRELLLDIARREGIALDQVVAVGDGANDLLMLDAAGLGVAWNAKPRVQMEADARLNGKSLLDLLFLFGFTAEEVALLTAPDSPENTQ